MRSEQEMLQLILDFTSRDDNIRAVLLNGSRANPNAPRDPFQDFDLLCLVRDVTPYVRNRDIPPRFGEIMILQLPDDMGQPRWPAEVHYSYLMQYMDGNRIDLGFHSLARIEDVIHDSLTVVLQDKDGILKDVPPPSDKDYLVEQPTEKAFQDCCNEFWWCSPYVAKGLWRGELTYAKYILEEVIRPELMKMLVWYFGLRTAFKKSPGKAGKYLKAGLEPETWAELEATYPDSKFEHIWDSLFVMGRLFRRIAQVMASAYGFEYSQGDDNRVSAYLLKIKNLPGDAREIV
ncbi:MAG: aminoglycoside 6-adenylyltransferase [Chloroflexota bacterium]